MTKKSVTSLALAAGCAIALAVPAAQAQTTETQVVATPQRVNAGDRAGWLAARNNVESREYTRLLQTNRSFREARIRKECSPISDMQLRQNCFASFSEYTPFIGSTRLASRNAPSGMMTGSSTGTMTTTTTGSGYSPDMNGAGYGSSINNNHTTPMNNFGASRNLPAEYSGGMVQAPGAMPNYPGPRPSGPLSGGGAGGAK
jgi:hypothetical protein